MGDDLRIRVGDELHALGLQPLAQGEEVFDDTVVHHRDAAGLADMGVGVQVGRLAVGGPAGVAEADMAMDVLPVVDHVPQHLQAALGLGDLQTLLRVVDSDTGGVIAPVFQPGKTVQQDGRDLFSSDKTNNTTHGKTFLLGI